MERFRTIKVSDPAFESGNLRFITLKSSHLKGRGNICVFVPPNIDTEDLPIAILLHGVYGSALSWSQAGGAHITALDMIQKGEIQPMILAMPSDGLWGDGSAYARHSGLDFEKWIVEDVIDAVRLHIPQAAHSTRTFIGGLSMGGFGALRIGAKYGNRFAAVSGMSAITAFDQMKLFVEEKDAEYHDTDIETLSVFQTMIEHRATLPPIRFDCGRDDLLIEHNRLLHQQLEQARIEHIYQENEGIHEWPYWIKHLKETLRFFNDNS